MAEKIGVSPLSVMDKVGATAGVAGMTVGSAQLGAIVASLLGVGSTSVGSVMGPHGAVLTGLFLINNPVGWAMVFASAAIGGGLAYRSFRK